VNLLLQIKEYSNALAAAAKRGVTKIVKYLVEQSANINLLLQIRRYSSALAAIAY